MTDQIPNPRESEILKMVQQARSIAISGHVSPDGDCLGSMLALGLGLRSFHPQVHFLKVDLIPKFLDFLPGLSELQEPNTDETYDLFIALDSSSSDRLGKAKEVMQRGKKTLLIDHHKSCERYAMVNYVDPSASSTSELIYRILKGMEISITPEIATNIFTGMTTDTGRFMYESCSPETMRIAAELMESGIDRDDIMQRLYQSSSLSSLYLTAELIESTKLYMDNRVAITTVTQSQLAELGAVESDLEDKVTIFRDAEEVEVSCLIRETIRGDYKISMRSKAIVDVSGLCTELGGGGHRRAGGFSMRKEPEEITRIILERLGDEGISR